MMMMNPNNNYSSYHDVRTLASARLKAYYDAGSLEEQPQYSGLLLAYTTAAGDDDADEDGGGERATSMPPHRGTAGACLTTPLWLLFIVFQIYGLAVSRTPEVSAACNGEGLWIYMLVRLVLSMGAGLVLLLCGGWLSLLLLFRHGGQHKHAAAAPMMMMGGGGGLGLLLLVLVFYATVLGVGAPLVMEALNSPACVAALSDASAWTHSPVLAIVGALYVALDALLLLLLLLAGCAGACAAAAAGSS
jgi:hypothetical protein